MNLNQLIAQLYYINQICYCLVYMLCFVSSNAWFHLELLIVFCT